MARLLVVVLQFFDFFHLFNNVKNTPVLILILRRRRARAPLVASWEIACLRVLHLVVAGAVGGVAIFVPLRRRTIDRYYSALTWYTIAVALDGRHHYCTTSQFRRVLVRF